MMFEKVQSLCKSRGITIAKLERDLDFANASIVSWRGGTVPRADRLKMVADYFGVSMEYLMADERKEDA